MAQRSARIRIALAAATAVSLTVGVGACSSGGSSSSSGGGKTFTYWSMWKTGEPQQKVIAAAISDFEKQTGDKVNVQWVGRQVMQKLTPALNTNNVPDLVDGPVSKAYPTLVATGQALGLKGAYAAKAGNDTAGSVIPAKYLKDINIKLPDGQPWMVPYNIQTDGIWFNAAKYPQYKSNPPATWDDFVKQLDALKAKGVTPIAADGNVPGYNDYWFVTLMTQLGGPGSLKKIAADKTGNAWKGALPLKAAQKVEQLVKGGYLIKGYQAAQFPYEQQQWASNKAAFILMGSWLPTEASSYAADGMVHDSFPFPSMGGADSARVDLSGFEIPKKAKNPTAAEKFTAFFLQKKYQTMWAKDAQVIPIRSDVAVPKALTNAVKSLQTATSFRQQDDGILFPGYMEKVFYPLDDQLFFGKITAQQFVDKMADAQKTYWESQG